MKDLIIGIDAGTSVIKSIAFDLSGNQIASHAITNSYENVDGGGAEQDMARTWRDAAMTLKALADELPELARRTAAIAVTGQGDGTWLIDQQGDPIAPAWLWLDARATSLVDEFRARPEDQLRFARTATGLAACQQGAQMLWMDRYTPEVLKNSATAMHCKDWLFYKLTDIRATDPSEGCFTFGDFASRSYSDEVIESLGLGQYQRLLPPMIEGTRESFPLSRNGANASGLLEGTPVVLGYVDVICSALGAGLYEAEASPGCTIIGSTGMHMQLKQTAADVVLNEERTGYTMPMPIPGVYAQMQSNMASTLNVDWLLDMACSLLVSQGVDRQRRDLIPMIDEWIDQADPAGVIYQPFISEAGERGPFIDGNARAGFVGLSTQHEFCDLMRSVVEGLAFAARDCYVAMGSLPAEVRLTGGAARSHAVRQIFGAVLGAAVRTSSRDEAGAAGAAMMATLAINHYPNMEACTKEWVSPRLGEPNTPDVTLKEHYAETFEAYRETRMALRPVWNIMANRTGKTL